MNIAKICIGCMHEVENKQQMKFCTRCGQDLKNFKAEKHLLQPYMVLNEKYFVGKAISGDEMSITYMGYALNLDMPVLIKEFYPKGFVKRNSEESPSISIIDDTKMAEITNLKETFVSKSREVSEAVNKTVKNNEIDAFDENGTTYIIDKYVENNAQNEAPSSAGMSNQTFVPNQAMNMPNQAPVPNQPINEPNQALVQNQAMNMPNQTFVPNQAMNMPNQTFVPNQAMNMPNQTFVPNQAMNISNQEPVQKKKKNVFVRILVAISAICIIAATVIMAYIAKEYLWDAESKTFVFSNFEKVINGKSRNEEDNKDAASGVEAETQSATQEEKATKYLEDMLHDKDYEALIDEILKGDNEALDEYEDEVNEILRQAIVGHQTLCLDKVNSAVNNNELKGVYNIINAEIVYREELAKKGAPAEFVSTDELYGKSDEIKPKYEQYIYQKTTEYAKNADAENVDALFKEADVILSGDTYNRKKEITYGTLVANNSLLIDTSNGSRAAMDYINSNLHLTANNAYCMELWDVYDHKLGGGAYEITTPNAKKNGYLLVDSDTRLISESELDSLSRYEVYLAMFEIYARHGRLFTDAMVTDFFSKNSWYTGTIDAVNFDESCLNQTEIDNINTIVNYRKAKGWFGY